MTVFFFCLLLERLTDRIHGEIIYHFVVLSHDHLHLAEVMATINTDISMQMLWLRISLNARQRIDWSKLAGWTYGYVFLTWTKARECMQMLYHLANPTFITDTSYCLDSKLAFLKAYSYAIAYKHLFKSFLLFYFQCAVTMSYGFVLSMPEVQRESIHRRAKGRVMTKYLLKQHIPSC